jgi:hypothetical protein
MAPDEDIKERLRDAENGLDILASKIVEYRAEGERRHGERRQNCKTDCPAVLGLSQEVTSKIDKLSGDIRGLRGLYGLLYAFGIVVLGGTISWLTMEIKEVRLDLNSHSVVQAGQIARINTELDHMKEDKSDHMKDSKGDPK